MAEKKKYGLIVPNKSKSKSVPQKQNLNVFNDSSEDETGNKKESIMDWAESSIKNSGNSGQKSLQRKLLREALKEDSTVFQYDDVYDEMKNNEETQLKARKKENAKKPKYINTILQHAEKRKIDLEKRQERKIQKEREAEGDEFADKESFVTSSYLKKLEEIAKHDKAEALEKLREEKDDVLKHKNFNKFYNSLYKMKMGEDSTQIKTEDSVTANDNISSEKVDGSCSGQKSEREKSDSNNSSSKARKRDEHCEENIKIKEEPSDSEIEEDSIKDCVDVCVSSSSKIDDIKSPHSKEKDRIDKMKENQEKFKLLFAKRTVGTKFDEAVQRYFQRQAGQIIEA